MFNIVKIFTLWISIKHKLNLNTFIHTYPVSKTLHRISLLGLFLVWEKYLLYIFIWTDSYDSYYAIYLQGELFSFNKLMSCVQKNNKIFQNQLKFTILNLIFSKIFMKIPSEFFHYFLLQTIELSLFSHRLSFLCFKNSFLFYAACNEEVKSIKIKKL